LRPAADVAPPLLPSVSTMLAAVAAATNARPITIGHHGNLDIAENATDATRDPLKEAEMSAVGTRTRTPEEYLEGLRDGREVWYRGERVDDVTAHPELGIAARHGALDFHGPSTEPSRFYRLPGNGRGLGSGHYSGVRSEGA
jgi:hypothetical protein